MVFFSWGMTVAILALVDMTKVASFSGGWWALLAIGNLGFALAWWAIRR